MDVGGKTPGSMPVQATTIFEEGMRLPPVKLYKGGEFDSELLETFAHNTRLPEHAEADIKALAAGTAVAESRVQELCDRFGKETYLEGCDAILDRTRDGMINLIREFVPEGERYTFEDYVDDDGMGNGPIKLHLEIYREGDTVHLDWEGTDDQVPGTVNFLLNEKMFKMFTGVFLIMAFDPLLTFNDGYYDLFEVNLPEGTVVQPEFPAALGNRLPLMARQFDVLQATFSKLIDGFSVAGSYGTSPNLVYAGTDSEGNDFQMLEILYGGIPPDRAATASTATPGGRCSGPSPPSTRRPTTRSRSTSTALELTPVVPASSAAATGSRRSTPSRRTARSPSRTIAHTPTRGASTAENTPRPARSSSFGQTAPRRNFPPRSRTSPFRPVTSSSSGPPAAAAWATPSSATLNSSPRRSGRGSSRPTLPVRSTASSSTMTPLMMTRPRQLVRIAASLAASPQSSITDRSRTTRNSPTRSPTSAASSRIATTDDHTSIIPL